MITVTEAIGFVPAKRPVVEIIEQLQKIAAEYGSLCRVVISERSFSWDLSEVDLYVEYERPETEEEYKRRQFADSLDKLLRK